MVSPRIASLAAKYAPPPANALTPAVDDMLTIARGAARDGAKLLWQGEKRPGDADAEEPVEPRGVDGPERGRPEPLARVVELDVETSRQAAEFGPEPTNGGHVPKVDRDDVGKASYLRGLGVEPVQRRLVRGGEDRSCAAPGELPGGGRPDPAAHPDDDGGASGEVGALDLAGGRLVARPVKLPDFGTGGTFRGSPIPGAWCSEFGS